MKSSIIWKLVLTALVLLWSVASMVPLKDADFNEYIATRATAKQDEFAKILAEAQKRVDPVNYKTDATKSATLFKAITDHANANNIDLAQFFTNVNVNDIKILKKRNDILMKELYRQSKSPLKRGLDLVGGVSFTLEISGDELASDAFMRKEQIDDVIRVIDGRINGLGVTEPTIRPLGGNAIEVQMPGESLSDNPEAIEEISRPAKLEFKLVHRTVVPSSAKAPRSEWPIGHELMIMENESGGKLVEEALYVERRASALGSVIKNAWVSPTDQGGYVIVMDFTSEGADVMNKLTRSIVAGNRETHTVQRLGIVLDGKLISAPNNDVILTSGGSITGHFTQREALELANALNNPLKVGLTRTSVNEVGANMAADARNASIVAGLIGVSLVMLFMLLYYRGFGFLAMLTVLANVVMVVGVLASFGATLTLPGIAALVLTVAMAVDANILIYERMREELALGKSHLASLEAGYEKAFSTIVDANVTTFFTAMILYWFGTGPIKGFGVTLAIGIVATLFMALVFGRALSELAVRAGMFKGSFNFRLIGETNLDVLKTARKAFVFSWIVVLIGVGAIFVRGEKSLSIDFTGGELTTLSFEKQLPIGDVLSVGTATGGENAIGEIQASYKKDITSGKEFLSLQTESGRGDIALFALNTKFPEANFQIVGRENIGASVSADIVKNAIWAVSLSFFVVLLYIALRFELGFGVGAVVALFHDMLMTVGLYISLGIFGIGSGQFSAPMIAAVLMSLGYSINDKIVVFDRIREELPLRPDMSLYDIVRLAVNKTLSRTIITSVTTFFAAWALFIWGTGIIKDFSFIFMIGIATGTFSSIFIASPVFYLWHKGKRKSVEEHELEVKYDWEE